MTTQNITPEITFNAEALTHHIENEMESAKRLKEDALHGLTTINRAQYAWHYTKEMATAEARHETYHAAWTTITRHPETLLAAMAAIAAEDPQDSWSGRDNDLARVMADARRDAAADIIRRITR